MERDRCESGWRNVTIWLSPEAVQAMETVKKKNSQASTSEVVSQCLAEATKMPSKASESNAVIAGILERLELIEDEFEMVREHVRRGNMRERTTVNKFELAETVAEWMVRNNKLGIHNIDPDQVWKELKSQGVVVHSTYQNFRLWWKRNKDRIKAAAQEAL